MGAEDLDAVFLPTLRAATEPLTTDELCARCGDADAAAGVGEWLSSAFVRGLVHTRRRERPLRIALTRRGLRAARRAGQRPAS